MLISVVIPAYNAEEYILRALNSMKNQTYKNFEVIVVNDGSIDNTRSLVENFMHENASLEIRLINIDNGGLANARNVGFKECKGDLYINLDADDYLENDTFELAIEKFINDEEVDICFYGYKSFEEDGTFFDYYEETKNWIDDPISGVNAFKLRIKRHIWICQGSAIYRMNLIKENRISNKPGFNQGEDMYFISKCLLSANKVSCFKKDNFCCMNRRDSMNNSKYNESFFEVNHLLLQLKEEVKSSKLIDQSVLHYIDLEFVSQYLAIVKRAARFFKHKDYIANFKKIPFTLDNINLADLKKDMSKLKRMEIGIFIKSKTLYYIFVRLYDRKR